MTLTIMNPDKVVVRNSTDETSEAGQTRAGSRATRYLLIGREGDPDQYNLLLTSGIEGDTGSWTTPRHTHPFDQFRIVLEGDYSVAKNAVMPCGWAGYFPESTYYGPQERAADMRMLTLQFGGASGSGKLSAAQMRKGREEAIKDKNGQFVDGMFVWTDGDGNLHRQDSHEAIWEAYLGHRPYYPAPRYDTYIAMNPEAFGWSSDPNARGVERKLLGNFSEREIKLAFIRLESRAQLRFGTERAAEIAFVRLGQVIIGEEVHPTETAISTAREDEPVTIVAADQGAELVYFKLPTFTDEEMQPTVPA